jgi:hypothetical protein
VSLLLAVLPKNFPIVGSFAIGKFGENVGHTQSNRIDTNAGKQLSLAATDV